MGNEKQVLLEQIAADILNDNICPDLAREATNLVMGCGNVDAEIVFIGEAPGKNEDLSGLPFVGAAGKFLTEMLAEINMKRDDIYITNIVKYRPPNNRDPSISEKEAFWPFLARQLMVIQPKIVVTLGRHSMECFLSDCKISDIHGRPHRIKFGKVSLTIVPLYHPAAALYNGGLRTTLIEDFKKLPKLVNYINLEEKEKYGSEETGKNSG